MKRKPQWCYNNCRFSYESQGFAMPDSPDKLSKARLMFWLEAAGKREAQENIPLCGPTGIKTFEYLTPPDLTRADVLIDNTIRCNPPQNVYPQGSMRSSAEQACRHWDSLLHRFNPDILGITFHPAGLRNAPNTTVFFKADVAKAWEMSKSGHRVLLLMGEKALKLFMPNLGNAQEATMKRWHGSFWPVRLEPPTDDLQASSKELTLWWNGTEPQAKVSMYDSEGFFTGLVQGNKNG